MVLAGKEMTLIFMCSLEPVAHYRVSVCVRVGLRVSVRGMCSKILYDH